MNKIMMSAALIATFCQAKANPVDLATYWPEPPTESPVLPADGEWTLSRDCSLGQKLQYVPSSTFDFSEGDHTLSVNGLSALYGNNAFRDTTTLFKGGVWDLGGNSLNISGVWDLDNWVDNMMVTLDHCVITNAKDVVGFVGGGKNARFVMKNHSVIHSSNWEWNSYWSSTKDGSDYHFDVIEGSKLLFPDLSFNTDSWYGTGAETTATSVFTLSDPGTELLCGNSATVSIGVACPNMALNVTNGASASCNALFVGKGGLAHDNHVYVENATFTSRLKTCIGEGDLANGATSNNTFTAVNSTVALTGTYDGLSVGKYSPNNLLFISNSTFTACCVELGKESEKASGNVFHVAGPNAKVNLSLVWWGWMDNPYRPFGRGPECAIVVEDGAYLGYLNEDFAYQWCLDFASTDCLICVKGEGSTMAVWGCSLSGRGNRLEILDGGLFKQKATFSTADGTACSVVVSNGTWQCSATEGMSFAGQDNRLVLAGDCPRVTCGRDWVFREGTTLEVRLPVAASGYGQSPIEIGGQLVVNQGAAIAIPNVEEFQKGLENSVDLPLVTAVPGIPIYYAVDGSVLDATNEALPKGCRIYCEENRLMLHVKHPPKGLAIVVR